MKMEEDDEYDEREAIIEEREELDRMYKAMGAIQEVED
jgi:hypothetical protein